MAVTRACCWTVAEYRRMVEAGILGSGDRVELLEGQILEMSPQTPPQAGTVSRINRLLQRELGERADIRVQLPLTLVASEPEPDLAVVRFDLGEYGDRHPSAADVLWLIEVAYTTQAFDREVKGPLYARAGVADYWVVDVAARQVCIYRQPTPQGYQSERVLRVGETVAPLAFPGLAIRLGDLFLPG